MTVPDDLRSLQNDDQLAAEREWKLRDAETTAEQLATFYTTISDHGVPPSVCRALVLGFANYIFCPDDEAIP